VKTAICLSGTCRSLEHTYKNIKENLIDAVEDCDVFMMVPKNPSSYKSLKYLNIPQLKKLSIEEEKENNISGLKFLPGWPPERSSKEIYIKMIISRYLLGLMVKQYETTHSVNYDRIIFSRMDINFFSNVERVINNLNLETLYIPDFHNNYGGAVDGYNDRFAVSNKENMYTYFNLPEFLIQYQDEGNLIHGETFLKWHLMNSGVNTEHVPLRFTRVRPDGTEIDLRLKNLLLESRDT